MIQDLLFKKSKINVLYVKIIVLWLTEETKEIGGHFLVEHTNLLETKDFPKSLIVMQ